VIEMNVETRMRAASIRVVSRDFLRVMQNEGVRQSSWKLLVEKIRRVGPCAHIPGAYVVVMDLSSVCKDSSIRGEMPSRANQILNDFEDLRMTSIWFVPDYFGKNIIPDMGAWVDGLDDLLEDIIGGIVEGGYADPAAFGFFMAGFGPLGLGADYGVFFDPDGEWALLDEEDEDLGLGEEDEGAEGGEGTGEEDDGTGGTIGTPRPGPKIYGIRATALQNLARQFLSYAESLYTEMKADVESDRFTALRQSKDDKPILDLVHDIY
jgi:hypothetical protein